MTPTKARIPSLLILFALAGHGSAWAQAAAAATSPEPTPPVPATDGESPTGPAGLTRESEVQGGQGDADAERARSLFFEGLAHADRLEWSRASEKFRAALALRQAPAVSFNLAWALAELDQLTEAARVLRDLREDARTQPDVRERAAGLTRSIDARAAHLTIDAGELTAGEQVMVDNLLLRPDEIGVPIALGPGEHVVVFARHGAVLLARPIHAGRGEQALVVIANLPVRRASAAAGGLANDVRTVAVRDREEYNPLADWRLWTVVAVVAGAALTTALIVSTESEREAPLRGDFSPGVLRWD